MNLDIKSLEIVETIRRGLNLSSQEEVIRMCLALGFEKLKSILPP